MTSMSTKVKMNKLMASIAAVAGVLGFAMMPTSALAASASPITTATTNVSVSFLPGILTFENAPTLDFGKHTIDGVYSAFDGSSSNVLQVNDARGSGAGWKVLGQLGSFKKGETVGLDGAALKLDGGPASQPTLESVNLVAGGDAARVVNAPENTGLGVWSGDWTNHSLDIPVSSQRVGAYTAVMTWTLEDTPA